MQLKSDCKDKAQVLSVSNASLEGEHIAREICDEICGRLSTLYERAGPPKHGIKGNADFLKEVRATTMALRKEVMG